MAKVQLSLPPASITTERSERLETGLNQAGRILRQVALYHEARAAWGEAEPLYQRAIAIGEKALGPDHPDLAIWLNSLAALHQATGRYAEAEPLYQRAIAILEADLPADHPEIATVRANYARLLASLGRSDQSAARTD